MSESSEGLMAAATRQKAGRPRIGFPPGGVKEPGWTDSALFMLVAGSASLAKSSHGVGAAERTPQERTASKVTSERMRTMNDILSESAMECCKAVIAPVTAAGLAR